MKSNAASSLHRRCTPPGNTTGIQRLVDLTVALQMGSCCRGSAAPWLRSEYAREKRDCADHLEVKSRSGGQAQNTGERSTQELRYGSLDAQDSKGMLHNEGL